jgi:hypothetical protein
MGKNSIRGLVIAVAIGAFALVPVALGGNAGRACPQSSAQACEKVGPRTGAAQPKAEQKRLRSQPRFAYESNGQQVWRAGNRIMQ